MAIAVRELRAPGSAGWAAEVADLYTAYARRVRGLVWRRTHDADTCDDLVQETFLRAARSWDRFDSHRDPWPWLATIAANVCHDAGRRRSARPEDAVDELPVIHATEGGYDADPLELAVARERRAALVDALTGLPDHQRRAVVLKDAEGWTAEDVAAFEGVSLQAMKSLVRRSRAALRHSYTKVLEERGLAAVVPVGLLARLRARVSRTLGGRVPSFPLPALALPIDAGSFLVAAALSVVITAGAAGAAIAPTRSIGAGAGAVSGPAMEVDPTDTSGAPAVPEVKVGASLDHSVGAPLSASAEAAVVRDGDKRTLDGIIAGKVGDTAIKAPFQGEFRCEATEARRAACDTAEQLPSL